MKGRMIYTKKGIANLASALFIIVVILLMFDHPNSPLRAPIYLTGKFYSLRMLRFIMNIICLYLIFYIFDRRYLKRMDKTQQDEFLQIASPKFFSGGMFMLFIYCITQQFLLVAHAVPLQHRYYFCYGIVSFAVLYVGGYLIFRLLDAKPIQDSA